MTASATRISYRKYEKRWRGPSFMRRARAIEPSQAPPVVWKGGRAQVTVHSRIPNSMLLAEQLGPLLLIQMRCGSVTISRPEGALTPADRQSTFILVLSGGASLRHYGRQIELYPGDITMYDHSAEYTLHFGQPTQVIMIRVNSTAIRQIFPVPDSFYGQRIPGDVGLTSTALAMAKDLSAKLETRPGLHFNERVATHLLDVLATAYAEVMDEPSSATSLMERRFWKVRLFIEENLRDPSLSPSLVAERLKLSDRYLRMIFAVSDESPSAYILRRRLEECARQFSDERWRGRSITEIAFSWGFNSAPHFTRTFRQHFGMAPSQYRLKHATERAEPALLQ
ncbi:MULTISPECIES: helix-turn-helix domain-containing protein [unclassified Sphingobium]|uniref:helix-turn-helix domain-containing protein n=3 Tax=Sphingomonadaceae TaxID=41297 RepID=UPI002224E631|nr:MULTISPECIES: helix-turn-helix domain-containing protein [unclassified Sphingobium]MCW2380593.1 AraC-like DNA-binding protein [Sphingobium sp. B2D3B]MCW2389281.1 AraC-like DNA-binding protein [Sphingobium sp. B11D3B]MCW2394161.1 AraC-like DNA-binding protein [Sphingobium sp. B8D3B]MCW2399300.1 AraC-like DNA-binding protein [Sphingobium sp. B2D3C]MCW2417675.1 AraC-like DNA-binding protein [Sphingobium sp. B8D3C]